jgi:hypothetical protein
MLKLCPVLAKRLANPYIKEKKKKLGMGVHAYLPSYNRKLK